MAVWIISNGHEHSICYQFARFFIVVCIMCSLSFFNLGAGKTMKQCMCLYLRMKEQAFIGSRPYTSDNLESLLKDTLGANTVMTDIKHPKVMVTGVMADRKPVDLHFFRNYKSASDILGIVTPDR